ncbi:hypothetical protein [Streptomyces sp. NPDC014995]|uniref:hypothetical protein n=1 Tax=Streptomyces sp. NPDC014995 TaxID=3364936 RepID=UPI0036F9B1DD
MRAPHRLLGDLRRDHEHPADVLARLRREIDDSVADHRAAAKGSLVAWGERSVVVTVAPRGRRRARAATGPGVGPGSGGRRHAERGHP